MARPGVTWDFLLTHTTFSGVHVTIELKPRCITKKKDHGINFPSVQTLTTSPISGMGTIITNRATSDQ
jgi:hypothetical protein